jgi:2-polyprenyl-6-methoxyphenol hydroxylase-like FAD-dependent oxidoreductase
MEWAPAVLLIDVQDAAYLALPFAGEGANLVIYDLAELSKAIAASLCDTEIALLA